MAKSGDKQSYVENKFESLTGNAGGVLSSESESTIEEHSKDVDQSVVQANQAAAQVSAGGGSDNSVPKMTNKRPTRTFNYGARRPMLIAQVFKSYEEAREFVIAHGVVKIKHYRELQGKHTDLPKNPVQVYAGKWVDWNTFFDIPEYYTLDELCQVVRGMGLITTRSYNEARQTDPKMPPEPFKIYKGFPGYAVLFGTEELPYKTIEEAAAACARVGIKHVDDYRRKRYLDPRLPKSPSKTYGREFCNWALFLGIDESDAPDPSVYGFYPTFAEFMEAVKRLDVTSKEDYLRKYSQDPMLPARPENTYLTQWRGWAPITQAKTTYFCTTWQQARELALPHKFFGAEDYRKNWRVDSRLPASPEKRFSDFPGWPAFLMPEACSNLEDLKLAIKILKLKTVEAYHTARPLYPLLPENPEKLFADEWKGWPNALGLPDPYPYEDLKAIAIQHKCRTRSDYRALQKKLKDPRMPHFPENTYDEWVNIYDFLDLDLPFKLEQISEQSKGWRDDFAHFIDNSPVRGSLDHSLCKFLRNYIEPNDLGGNVREFLTKKVVDTKKFLQFLEAESDPIIGRRIWFEVNKYLNDALKRHFTEEDENGFLYIVPGASNPLAAVEFQGQREKPSESVKPVLAYQYVEEVRNWIIPQEAKSFADLKNIQSFDADFREVDKSLLDFDDPNCIWRESGGKYYLWVPTFWVALYCLVSVPARGRQIMYNDSGEADEYIVELVDGKPAWVKNTGSLAILGNQKGFVKRELDSEGKPAWGMSFTSNKTSYDGAGYDVPWIPEPMIYWLTVLRDWQRKYNPITRITPWVDCKNTGLSKKKLARKGSNTFLFRGFEEDQPPAFAPALTVRLAAALYNIQPRNLVLATFDEEARTSALTAYDSRFTPHSMRVSLITAYVAEFGMPIHIIMKIAGHASIVMSVYYTKIGGAKMRHQMAEGEKRALMNKAVHAQLMIEQNRLDELRHQLVSNSEEALAALMSGMTGTQLVRDYGICPYAGSRCEDGGPLINVDVNHATPAGYLGMQNCPRCRHFITGPVFLGGLSALWTEISLAVTLIFEQYSDMDKLATENKLKIQALDREEAMCMRAGIEFDETGRVGLELANSRLHADMEGLATKMDLHLCDMQAITALINDSRVVLNNQAQVAEEGESVPLQLIATDRNDIEIEYEETSFYQHLNEVCVNATIYQSSSAMLATPRRSQIIDRMAQMNDLRPTMFNLSEKEQLVLGNQITEFFMTRLNSWNKVNKLITGELLIDDLQGPDRISKPDFARLLETRPSLNAPALPYLEEVDVIKVDTFA
ncbi:gamma-mobile-trio integrase GmtZ [Pseudomonas monteilii]|uniref:gamma-mobile-trio integrase GmtZ n=1 Tax=Pseudomonas monteilii TaxID=76759 RepID=UPI0018A4725B|nr:VPA1269 family protein [Pseudomonas monteilii]BBV98450.1 hypothetical protein STW0522PSE72_38010 [Pseudomonas monteilii]